MFRFARLCSNVFRIYQKRFIFINYIFIRTQRFVSARLTRNPLSSARRSLKRPAKIALKNSNYAYVIEEGKITIEGESASLRDDPRIRQAYLGKLADAASAE